jgi:hypothetical protein
MRTILITLALLTVARTLAAQCPNGRPSPRELADRDGYGRAMALSGERLVVGAPFDDDMGTDAGAAYVFDGSGLDWTQAATLTAADGADKDTFGEAVAIDGDTVVVGAAYDDDLGSNSGAAYVFELLNGAWLQTAKLLPADGDAGDAFGHSVAVRGEEIVIGAPGDSDVIFGAGSTYVFAKQAGAWVEVDKLLPSDPAGNEGFGTAIAIDAATIAVGIARDGERGAYAGAVELFTRSGGGWSSAQKLTAGDGAAYDYFGEALALAQDTLVVAAYNDSDLGSDAGAAYVFQRSGGAFVEAAKLLAPDGAAGDNFGQSVSLSSDGRTAVVGANGDDTMGTQSGAAYLFRRFGEAFEPAAKLIAGDGQPLDSFGYGTAVDGDRVVVGGFGGSTTVPGTGVIWSYSADGQLCPDLTAMPSSISLGAGGSQALCLTPGPGWEDHWYWMLGSASGTTPGTQIGGVNVPVNVDAYLLFSALQPNQGPLVNTLGTLDSAAQATARIEVAPGTDPALVGVHLDHCFVLWDPTTGAIDFASNAEGLDLTP